MSKTVTIFIYFLLNYNYTLACKDVQSTSTSKCTKEQYLETESAFLFFFGTRLATDRTRISGYFVIYGVCQSGRKGRALL